MAPFLTESRVRLVLMTCIVVFMIAVEVLFLTKPDVQKWRERTADYLPIGILASSTRQKQNIQQGFPPNDIKLDDEKLENSPEEEHEHRRHRGLVARKQHGRRGGSGNNNNNNNEDEDKHQAKYFQEPGGDIQFGHYDARFFQGKVPYGEHGPALRDLARAYLETLRGETIGVETWLAHGSLLGWWWNGRIMPWDYDLDAQMSTASLRYLAESWNGTEFEYTTTVYQDDGRPGGEGRKEVEVVEVVGEEKKKKNKKKTKRYLLDINPHYDSPRGNAQNIIDARWIDMDNGLFIDVTGLKEREPGEKPGEWSCKNHHYYGTTEIWPLRQTEFEGVPASVPYAFDEILVAEYGEKSLTKTEWNGHRWDPHVKEWIKKQPTASKHKTIVVYVEVPAKQGNEGGG